MFTYKQYYEICTRKYCEYDMYALSVRNIFHHIDHTELWSFMVEQTLHRTSQIDCRAHLNKELRNWTLEIVHIGRGTHRVSNIGDLGRDGRTCIYPTC